MKDGTERIRVIDSHTGGEPTRVVVSNGPDLGSGSLADRREVFRSRWDGFRRAVVKEPRGSDVLVGAVLCEPTDAGSAAGVIFFNNVGYLGMCVHGTIGVVATLARLRRLAPGEHRFETPVGVVTCVLEESGRVRVRNVPSYRAAAAVRVDVEGWGVIHGDLAWGGNWFFLTEEHGQRIEWANVERLTDVAWRIRQALAAQGIRGTDGGEIDHIELFGPPQAPDADSKNFVLCPGKAYDRSPCGTGTSAKLACLMAAGKLQPGEIWRQEGIVGSVFETSGQWDGERVLPTVCGRAFVTAEAELILEAEDPYRWGIEG